MPKHIALLLCAVLLLTGCITPGRTLYPLPPTPVSGTVLPFKVIVQEVISYSIGTEPVMYLVTSLDDAQVVANLLMEGAEIATMRAQQPEQFHSAPRSERFLERVQQLEAGQILLALFDAPHGTATTAIRARRVVLQGDDIYVYAGICHFVAGGSPVIQDYEIVQVTLPPESPPAADLTPILLAYDVNC